MAIALDIDPEVMGGAIVCALFGVNRALAKRKSSDEVMELTIPWNKITNVQLLEGKVVCTVKKFKPKGELYFIPEQDPAIFIDSIKERIS